MLSSNFLMGVAQGFMEGKVEQTKAEREAEKLRIEEQSKLDREFAGAIAGAINSKNFRPESIPILYEAYGKKSEYDPSRYAEFANLASKVANTEKFGTYDLNLVQEIDYDKMSAFERSQVFWESWNRQLVSEEEFQRTLTYFKSDKNARDFLANQVRNNEYELRLGNVTRQTAANRTGEISYIDLPSQYGNAARLFDELGFQSVSEDADKAIAENLIDFDPDTEVAVLMNTRQTGGALTPVAVGVDKNTYALWGEMASNAGYKSVQGMLTDFSIDSSFRNVDETEEQFAFRQNELLTNAAKVYSEYGSFLANPATMDAAKSEAFLARMKELSGNNRENQIRMMSMMVPTPANVFKKTRQNRYAGNSSQSIKPVMSGSQYVERVTGLKVDDFNEGLKAQRDAVDYLDRLMELEGQISDEVGTGWVRSSAALLARFGVQIQQGPTTLSNLFGTNSDFAATAQNTNQEDLQAVIQKVRPNIKLSNISEAEAIRLTLAAKMARAVDPSGRLSNQDFEIQLRRLGDGAFTTYSEIATKLKTVRTEFAQDLQYKNRLKAVIDNQAELTPQVARTIEASMRMRNIEGQIFGAKGRGGVVGSDASVTEQTTQTKTQKPEESPETLQLTLFTNKDGTTFYSDGTGNYYKDPQGTQSVTDAEFIAANPREK
jgi:hypothetical protein